MTLDERQAILDELGADGLIVALYPSDDPRRIALLRLSHAIENAVTQTEWAGDFFSRFLFNPDEYVADEALCEEAAALASKLQVLQAELLKSLPVLSKRGINRVEGEAAGLRGNAQAQPGKGQERPGDRPTQDPDDWGDVPF